VELYLCFPIRTCAVRREKILFVLFGPVEHGGYFVCRSSLLLRSPLTFQTALSHLTTFGGAELFNLYVRVLTDDFTLFLSKIGPQLRHDPFQNIY
jgi:hypothetical protein